MLLDPLKHLLLVSCQPVTGGPMDTAENVVGFARAAEAGGAAALRIESAAYLRAVRPVTRLPIVGIVKRDLDDSPVRITPFLSDVEDLADAGADIIAVDATQRVRPVPVATLIAAIHARGRLAMADCSSLEDARAALAAGADCVGTTLSGYVGEAVPDEPDFELITRMRELTPYVIAEGRIKSTEQAAEALRRGAHMVVVGSAITRTEHITQWYVDALRRVRQGADATLLAIDIGGTKCLAALVAGGVVVDEVQIATDPMAGPDRWIAALAEATAAWRGRYAALGAAVTGIVDDGHWSALNKATLPIPDAYPLKARLGAAFGVPVVAVNDAQAAAWHEYRHGAGAGEDTVFLTISTGIGGGVVLNGRLLGGISGHFGILRGPSSDPAQPLENDVSGRWMARRAEAAGHAVDAAGVFRAAAGGAAWAEEILNVSARRVALLCQDIQLGFDPRRIVIGGGIGLAPGYLERVEAQLPDLGRRLRPLLVAAKGGRHAGVLGAADLVRNLL